MSLKKLVCPECETVMRPKSPVAPGKKVKCPKCETVFTARADEDEDEVEDLDEVEDERPRKKAAKKKAPAKAEARPPAKKKDEESETYGYIKEEGEGEEDEEEDDGKPKINYATDDSVRDLRGPAIVMLRSPTGWLQFVSLIGAFGWLAFTVMIIIPFAFPIPPDVKTDKRGNPVKEDPNKPKPPGSARKKFLEVWQWIDFTEVVELEAPAF
ncbi:MAG: hypothetical protein K2W96_18545, partial [Gemmataceae bacterium]|nr:hypothetical protein [Gemmataceae bacterium]